MTLEELAAALGVDERSIRRDEASVLRKLQRAYRGTQHSPEHVVRAIALVLAERDQFPKIPRRFSGNRPQGVVHGPRAARSPDFPVVGRRAGLLSKDERMTKTKATTQMLLSKLEALAHNHPEWEATFSAAKDAIDADYAAAESVLFPLELQPVTADAISTYAFHIQRFAVGSYATELARLHQRSLRTFPGVAALCRSREALEDVERAAGANAVPAGGESYAEAARRMAEPALRVFRAEVARQLIEPAHESDAPKALLQADADGKRLAELKVKRDAWLEAESVRIDAEKSAAEQADADKAIEKARQAELAHQTEQAAYEARQREHRDAQADALAQRLLRLAAKKKTDELRCSDNTSFGIRALVAQASARGLSLEQIKFFTAACMAAEGASS